MLNAASTLIMIVVVAIILIGAVGLVPLVWVTVLLKAEAPQRRLVELVRAVRHPCAGGCPCRTSRRDPACRPRDQQ
jgi:uncharacterized membrane protein YqiK